MNADGVGHGRAVANTLLAVGSMAVLLATIA